MAGSAKQQWASFMKEPSTPESVNKRKFDDKSYDSTERKRKFIPHWCDLFPSLESFVRTAYYISYKRHPFADFEWSSELQQINGLALGENHSNAKGCQMFMNIIARMSDLYVVVMVVTSMATRRKFWLVGEHNR